MLREEGLELELELERRWRRGASEEGERRTATCPILVFSVLTTEANRSVLVWMLYEAHGLLSNWAGPTLVICHFFLFGLFCSQSIKIFNNFYMGELLHNY